MQLDSAYCNDKSSANIGLESLMAKKVLVQLMAKKVLVSLMTKEAVDMTISVLP